jgi:dihydropteroate synthase
MGSAHAARLARYLGPVTQWRTRTRAFTIDRPIILGILNLTEDSFSGDGVGASIEEAVRRAEALRAAGADIIDTGAESARADRPVAEETAEAELIASAVTALVREGHAISVDSYKPAVARAGLEAGAEIANDISGLTLGDGVARTAAGSGAGYVLNYSFSVPKKRPDSPPVYGDVVVEHLAWFEQRIAALESLGLPPESLVIDPGIAFGKSHDEDIQLIRRLAELQTFGQPILLAHSRKNFIGSINGQPPAERDLETHMLSALAFAKGARLFRVHDPAGARRALDMAAAIELAHPGAFAPDATSWPWRAGASATHMTREAPSVNAPPGQRW